MKSTKCYVFALALVVLVAALTLSGCGTPTPAMGGADTGQSRGADAQGRTDRAGGADVEMPHIHGLGFSADGQQLLVPAHDGLRVYAGGRWQVPELPAHDYMGYAPTDNGFYSSGHPAPSAGLVNPLGLVKSTDGGKTLTTLGFQGQSDFHLMGVG